MTRKIFIIILSICAVLWLAFIFSNSLDNGSASTEKSSIVTEIVNAAVHFLGYDGDISHKFVRKFAHFSEFFVLSALISADISAIFYSRLHRNPYFLLLCSAASVPSCAIFACCDETIQLFSDGRAAQLTDVLIDSSGGLCGYALFALCFTVTAVLYKKIAKKSGFGK